MTEKETVIDEETVTFGIRTLTWDVKKGLCINGERVILRGACIHHDNGVLGACCYADAEARKVRILKENGYNAVSYTHLDVYKRQGPDTAVRKTWYRSDACI